MGWLSGWTYRIKLTVDHTKIDSDLAGFPVLVKLSSSSGLGSTDVTAVFDELGANYLKIAVTKDDGTTQLYVEVEQWDADNELAWLWVSRKGWSISSTEDTVLYLYYDATHANNTFYVSLGIPTSRPTWTGENGDKSVMSIASDGTYIYAAVRTNPASVRKIDPITMTTVGSWTDEVGYEQCNAVLYDGTYLYAGIYYPAGDQIGRVVKIDPTTMTTISVWTADDGLGRVFGLGFDGTYLYVSRDLVPASVMKVDPATMTTVDTWTGAAGDNNTLCNLVLYDGTYIYVSLWCTPARVIQINPSNMTTVATWTGAAGENYGYGLAYDDTYLYVGLYITPLSKVAKIDPTTMTTVTIWTGDTGEDCCHHLAYDGVHLYAAMATVNNVARVIVIETAAMTTLRKWNANAGEKDAYSILYDNGNIYLGIYGADPFPPPKIITRHISTQNWVWDENFMLVTHMHNDPDTTHVAGYTVCKNDGTKKSATEPAESDGVVYKGQTYDGTDDKITIAHSPSLNIINELTLEALVRSDVAKSSMPIDKNAINAATGAYGLMLRTDGAIRIYYKNMTSVDADAGVFLHDSAFHHVCGTFKWSTTTVVIYVDGAQVKTGTPSTDIGTNTNDVSIGNGFDNTSWVLNGRQDETRISNVARSAAWVKATKNACFDQLVTYSFEAGPAIAKVNRVISSKIAKVNKVPWLSISKVNKVG